jgi:hypothetical protein
MRIAAFGSVAGLLWMLGCGTTHLESDFEDVAPQSAELALSKSDFLESDWYFRQTFVEVPYGAARGFDGLVSDVEKVHWEVTEKHLVAYRTYEVVPGSDPDAGEPGWHEQPVAMYPILEHVGDTGAQWFERQAMRVDWVDQLDGVLWYGLPILEGTSWTVRAAADADAPVVAYFDAAATRIPNIDAGSYAKGALYYADFTNRVAITALESSFHDCRRAQDPNDFTRTLDPHAYEIGVRTSLLRVPAHSDYEPVAYDALDYNKFGYFRRGRQTVDKYLGARLSGRLHVATRHNLWRDTWQRDGSGELRRDEEGRLVPKPFAERTPRPIVFHLSEDFPDYLVQPSFDAAASWDGALRRAVATAQQVDVGSVPQMLIVCHNPVDAEDPALCGERDTRVRKGDLRYDQIVSIDQPQLCGLLGFGPSQSDPETGEILSAQAIVYEEAAANLAQFALDLIRFVNGDLEIEGLHDADDVRAAVRARLDPSLPGVGSQLNGIALPDAIGATAPVALSGAAAERARSLAGRPPVVASGRQRKSPREALEGSGVLDALSTSSGMKLTDLSAELERERAPLVDPERGCALPTDFQDAVLGLALSYLGRTDYDQILIELSQAIHADVVAHELGHTLGLRHNFAASADYVNYTDEYWRLKSEGVLGVDDSGSLAVLPLTHPLRYLDDVFFLSQQTSAQAISGMRTHARSSVMDYEARPFGGFPGIAKYDEAAIVYGYTTGRDRTVTEEAEDSPEFNAQQRGYVEVFDQPGDAAGLLRHFESASSPELDKLAESVHYHTFVSYLASSGTDPLAGEPPNPPADGALAAQLVRERLRSRRLVRLQDLQAPAEVEVPYLFVDDVFNWTKQSANVFDAGADPLELALDTIGRYRDYYPFQFFGRDRADFDPELVAIGTVNRYLLPLYDNFNRFYLSLSRPAFDPILGASRELGALASINALAEIAGSTPSYGAYVADGDVHRLVSFEPDASADVIVPPGVGRRWSSVQDNTPNDLTYVPFSYVEAGHDRVAAYALQILLGLVPTFFVSEGEGYQATFAGPFAIFEPQLTTLFNALFLQDSAVLGPRVGSDGAGGVTITRPPLFALDLGGGFYLDPETWRLTAAPLDDDLALSPGPHLDVAQGRGQKLDAGVTGMWLFSSLSSSGIGLQYQDQARVFRVGSGEELTPGDGFETVTYCDTLGSGLCYGALQPIDSSDPGLAARLIRRAQALHPQAEAGDFIAADQLETLVQDMDLLRSLYAVFGHL